MRNRGWRYCRYNLVNTRLTESGLDGRVVERSLASSAELGEALEQVFGIEPPAPVEAVYATIAG